MRSSRWFIIGIVLFLLIMFVVESHLPKKFVWNPTFAQHDHQPLGCAVFDDVLREREYPSGREDFKTSSNTAHPSGW